MAVRASSVMLTKADTIATAFDKIYTAAVAQVLGNWALLEKSDSAEIIHQFRVGIRRTRTALRMFETDATEARIADIDAQLARLSRLIGKVRDFDVLRDDVLPRLRDIPIAEGMAKLSAALATERARTIAEVRASLAAPEWKALRKTLAGTNATSTDFFDPALAEKHIAKFAARRLRRAMSRVRKRARDLETLGMDDLHRIRKAAKALRYKFDYLNALYPRKEGAEFIEHLKRMQDAFGELNDLSLVACLEPVASAHRGDAELQRAVGYLDGWLMARASITRQAAEAAWTAVRHTDLANNEFRVT